MKCDVCNLDSAISIGGFFDMKYFCFGHFLEWLFRSEQKEIELPQERLDILNYD
jgi:hypothetical protein